MLEKYGPWAFLAFCWLAAAAQQQLLEGWFIEDSAISFAYARNWVAGEGLVPWPGGERVEGYSNFAWVVLIAIGEIFGLSGFDTAKPLALLFTGWALFASWKVAERALPEDARRWALVAPALLATSSVFNMWAASGLENAMFGAILLSAIWRHDVEIREDRAPWSPLLWLGLALTRPEGPLYAAFAGLWWMIAALRRGRTPLDVVRWFFTFWIPGAALLAARLAYFAWPLPMTYYGKIGSGGPQLLNWDSRGWVQIRTYAETVWEGWYLPIYLLGLFGLDSRTRVGIAMIALAALAVLIVVAPMPAALALLVIALPFAAIGTERWELRCLLWTVASLSVIWPAYSNGDWMRGFRWMSLLAPSATVLLAVGLHALLSPLVQRTPAAYRTLAAISLPALFVGGLWGPKHYDNTTWFAKEGKNESPHRIKRRVNFTNGLKERLFLDDRLVNLDMDMGAFLWWNEQSMVDVAGLVNVPIAVHTWADRPFVHEYLLEEVRPHLAHMHGHWANTTELTEYTRFKRDWFELPPWKDGAVRLHPGEWLRRDLVFQPTWDGPSDRRVDFENGVVLHGWEVVEGPIGRGRAFYLKVGVQTTKRIPNREFRLIAFLTSGGRKTVSWDLPLTDDLLPMHRWRAQEVFIGQYALEVPGDFPLGNAGLGFAVLGPGGQVWAATGPHARAQEKALVYQGEARFPFAVPIGRYAVSDELAQATLFEAMDAADAGLCDHAERRWREAWLRIPKNTAWRSENREAVGASIARCWATEADNRPEKAVVLLERARTWSHRNRRLVEVAEPVADSLFEAGLAARAEGDWDRAYARFHEVLRVDPSRAWARRYAEEARNHRLGLGPLPMWGRATRASKTAPPI